MPTAESALRKEAMSRLIGLAAELAQRKPLRPLEDLDEMAGRTLGRRALRKAIDAADDRLRLMAIELRGIFDALGRPLP